MNSYAVAEARPFEFASAAGNGIGIGGSPGILPRPVLPGTAFRGIFLPSSA
ncbi:MAG TPA: hypothetical protein VGZ00_03550 [Candidatus Baltobacteraceae bacterium]|nr:hypothetical protein [Candidatus Baltobacteraceae bacterium]